MSLRFFLSHTDLQSVACAHRKASIDVAYWTKELLHLNELIKELSSLTAADPYQHSQLINSITRYTVERDDAAVNHSNALNFMLRCEDLLLRETPPISQIIKENSLWQKLS